MTDGTRWAWPPTEQSYSRHPSLPGEGGAGFQSSCVPCVALLPTPASNTPQATHRGVAFPSPFSPRRARGVEHANGRPGQSWRLRGPGANGS